MKRTLSPGTVTRLCLILGLAGLGLRLWLYATGVEPTGLLDRSHPGYRLSWLTALLALPLPFMTPRRRLRFRPSPLSCLGHLLRSLGFLLTVPGLLTGDGIPLARLAGILGLLCALCALGHIPAALKKKRLPLLCFGVEVVYFLLFMVCQYRLWSSEPELQHCLFFLLALVCLTYAAYARGAARTGAAGGRGYLPASRLALYACLAAVPGCAYGASLALWAAGLLLDGYAPPPEKPHAAA